MRARHYLGGHRGEVCFPAHLFEIDSFGLGAEDLVTSWQELWKHGSSEVFKTAENVEEV